jgi:hypothetical protein
MSQTTTVQAKLRTDQDHAEEHNHDHGHEEHDHSLAWVDLVRIGLVALACLASWLGRTTTFAPRTSHASLHGPVAVVPRPSARKGWPSTGACLREHCPLGRLLRPALARRAV